MRNIRNNLKKLKAICNEKSQEKLKYWMEKCYKEQIEL